MDALQTRGRGVHEAVAVAVAVAGEAAAKLSGQGGG